MSGYIVQIILNHSIIIPAILGLLRRNRMAVSYRPFLFLVFLGLVNETVSLALIESHQANSVNSNLYVLAEYLILLYQFRIWRACHAKQFLFFVWLGVAVWVADNLIFNQIYDANAGFRCYASIIIIFFSIEKMKRVIAEVKGNLLQEGSFLICSALLLYFGCKAFVEGFHLFHIPFSRAFYYNLWLTLSVINGISNLIFATAILCIPKKEEYILPY